MTNTGEQVEDQRRLTPLIIRSAAMTIRARPVLRSAPIVIADTQISVDDECGQVSRPVTTVITDHPSRIVDIRWSWQLSP